MTVYYFGARWDSPRLDQATQTSTPVGAVCLYCKEPIVVGDRGLWTPRIGAEGHATSEPAHAECELVHIHGHAFGVCPCRGWDTSSRTAARQLWLRIEDARGCSWEPADA